MKLLAHILRYILAAIVFMYAYVKIVHFQFSIPPEYKNLPVSAADGVTLTFSFFGYSFWLSLILGLVQLATAILILFRRTALLGLLCLFPILTFILLINICCDFPWFMPIWTGSLLAINFLLLLPYRERLGTLMAIALERSTRLTGSRAEWIGNILLVTALVIILYFYLRHLIAA